MTALSPLSVTARQCLVSLHETTVGSRLRPSGGIEIQEAPSHSNARPVVDDVATQKDAVLHDTDVSAEGRPLTVL